MTNVPRVVVGFLLLLVVALLIIRTFQRHLGSAPKFWRTVAWEQKDRPKFFQVDALGQVRETTDTRLRLCLPVGKTLVRVRACYDANLCSEWILATADVGTGGERCE